MTQAQLRAFVAVADTGSVRAAADRPVVTQPAVSAALAALQRSHGVPLVEPHGRGIRLTEAGGGGLRRLRTPRPWGCSPRRSWRREGSGEPAGGVVRIAAVTTASEHVLPRSLALFRARYPEAGITLEVGNRERVWALLEQHQVDVAIAGRPPAGRGFNVRGVRPNEFVSWPPRARMLTAGSRSPSAPSSRPHPAVAHRHPPTPHRHRPTFPRAPARPRRGTPGTEVPPSRGARRSPAASPILRDVAEAATW